MQVRDGKKKGASITLSTENAFRHFPVNGYLLATLWQNTPLPFLIYLAWDGFILTLCLAVASQAASVCALVAVR